MNCRTYIDEFLAAHADDELVGRERRAADEHVAGCIRCRIRLADDRAIKGIIGGREQITKIPADVRLRIRAAIGDLADNRSERAGFATAREQAHDRRRLAAWANRRHVRIAVSAAAAAFAFGVVIVGGRLGIETPAPVVPNNAVFSLASNQFDALSRSFAPNVPMAAASQRDGAYYAWVVNRSSDRQANDEADDLARAYREAGIPEDIYDLEAAGYGLYGGRIDETAGGYPIAYTLYRGEKGEILSICMHAPEFAAPIGARYWAGAHSFYEYKGHSICLTFHPDGHFISMLVANEPVAELLRDVTMADTSASSAS